MEVEFDSKVIRIGNSHAITIPMQYVKDGHIQKGETYVVSMIPKKENVITDGEIPS